MSSGNLRYALFYPEGSGYLWIGQLGNGAQASVDLVWSCANSQTNYDKVYVRKKTFPTIVEYELNDGTTGGAHTRREVAFQRSHRLIPTLIDWTHYRPLTYNSREYNLSDTSSIIFQYCNNGPLQIIIDHYHQKFQARYLADQIARRRIRGPIGVDTLPGSQDLRIPEPFIWKFFGQLLGIVNFLHQAKPGILHNDVLPINIFLHRSSADQLLPDCYLGDFGRASLMPAYTNWDAKGNALNPETTKSMMKDFEAVVMIVKMLMTLDNDIHLTPHMREIDTSTINDNWKDLMQREVPYPQFLVNYHNNVRDSRLNTNGDRDEVHPITADFDPVQWQIDNVENGPFYTPRLYETIKQFDRRVRAARRNKSNVDWAYLAQSIEAEAVEKLNQQGIVTFPSVDHDWKVLIQNPDLYRPGEVFPGPTMFTKDELLAIQDQLPTGPWKIAQVDKTTHEVVALSDRTYIAYEPRGLNGVIMEGQVRPAHDVSLPRSDRDTSELGWANIRNFQ